MGWHTVFTVIGFVLLMYATFSHDNVSAKWVAVAGCLAWVLALSFQVTRPGEWKWVAVIQGVNALLCLWKASQRYYAEETRREYERVMRP